MLWLSDAANLSHPSFPGRIGPDEFVWTVDMSEHNFWIPARFEDEQIGWRVTNGINACYRVHSYTVEELNNYFIFHLESYRYHLYRRELGILIKNEKLTQFAPRYSLVRAAERTFPYWNEHKKFRRNQFVPVEPIARDEYNDIQFESRKIWRKYLALNNLITTSYGTLYLDGQWVDTAKRQAEEMEIAFSAVPFLMHSVTLRDGRDGTWLLHFNLHSPDSKFGKLARQEMRETI